MELLTTHINADFDALAAVVAAQRLHPGAQIFFPGSREESVRRMLDSGFYRLRAVAAVDDLERRGDDDRVGHGEHEGMVREGRIEGGDLAGIRPHGLQPDAEDVALLEEKEGRIRAVVRASTEGMGGEPVKSKTISIAER
jgi:hypothetical protein